MTAQEIRESFLDFFKTRDHAVVSSSSLIPQDDPTILFTNAGMNQFKKIFQGLQAPKSPRATSVQKCIRAGGKHNDLENVGVTARHHTFFEMLGNFSFGDYFKEQAIVYAWEWVTGVLKLDPNRLYATVYTEDDEAYELWAKVAPQLANGRILRFGKHDNYWSMGETGPNGPCSEIHYDRGAQYACDKPDCKVNCDCDRFMEIWNLVFMQFNTNADGKTEPLPSPSIDTGAGLERIAALLQGGETNYDTDLFKPLLAGVTELSGVRYKAGPEGTSHRIIADHLRALAFSITDGAVPSNEGRGYVLRRILRRAARHGRQMGMRDPFLAKLLPALVDEMGRAYPDLKAKQKHVAVVLTAEEEQFGRTLDVGIDLFEKYAKAALADGSKTISGDAIFKLYDTYGFPADLTAVMARERGLQTDDAGFDAAMKIQKERSRTAGAFRSAFSAGSKPEWQKLGPTKFLYDTYESESRLLEFAPNEGAIILDRTPFYVESGGQVSDVGKIMVGDLIFDVKDVVSDGDLILHLGDVVGDVASPSKTAQARVDVERRRAIERNHTATHLLQAALQKVLGDHVHQSGSRVAPDRLRFDFTHHRAVSADELEKIELLINSHILDNISLNIEWSDLKEAKASGAMALFGEKYGDRVRVVTVPGFSIELCGGTHVGSTGEIGMLRIVSEGAIAAGIRRIEAVTGTGAQLLLRHQEQLLSRIGAALKVDASGVPDRVERLLQKQRELELHIKQLESQAARQMLSGSSEDVQQSNGHSFTFKFGDEWQRDRVTAFADELKKKKEASSGVFGSIDSKRGKVSVFFAASAGAIESGVHAGKAIQFITGSFDGRGGGKPHLGQGGFDRGELAESEIVDRLKQAAVQYFDQL